MTQVVVAQRMWQRRDTAGNWSSVNPVLAAGEIGVELGASPADTKFKIGNGVAPWNVLPYFSGGSATAGVVVLAGTSYEVSDLTPGAWHVFTAASAVTLSVLASADDSFSEFGLNSMSAPITVVEGSGTAVDPSAGGSMVVAPGGFALLKRRATNDYALVGATEAGGVDASDVPYDGTASGLAAETVQAAIDEVAASSSGLAPVVLLAGSLYSLADLTPGSWHVFTSDSVPVTITIADDSVAPVVGAAEFGIDARGAAGVTFVPDNLATVRPPKGGSLALEQGDFAVLKRLSADTYKLVGSTV